MYKYESVNMHTDVLGFVHMPHDACLCLPVDLWKLYSRIKSVSLLVGKLEAGGNSGIHQSLLGCT